MCQSHWSVLTHLKTRVTFGMCTYTCTTYSTYSFSGTRERHEFLPYVSIQLKRSHPPTRITVAMSTYMQTVQSGFFGRACCAHLSLDTCWHKVTYWWVSLQKGRERARPDLVCAHHRNLTTGTRIAQSFSPFSSQDGWQVCHPDPTRATNLFSKI
jgi:hypothetical protein